jgi:UDP-GlcNAc:undecaprenyl-phosphate GlcNAc-1-phosphate transferase
MYSPLLPGLVSAVLALFLTPLVRNLAWHFGIVDQPDQQRKMHSAPIPRTGGVAIFATIIGAYGLLLVVRFSSGAVVWGDLPLVLRLPPARIIVSIVGLIDDVFSLRPWIKLTAEAVAVALAWFGGIQVSANLDSDFVPNGQP